MTVLSEKMHDRADADNLPADHPIRTKADDFDAAADGYYSTPQTHSMKKFMACWARAKRAWSDYTGKPLI